MSASRGMRMAMIAPFAIVGMAVFVALGGFIMRALWNALLPPLFGLPSVTFWQALGLLVLSRLLFGGFGVHGMRGQRYRPVSERWPEMTPEQRERFRRGMWGRFGFAPTTREQDEREAPRL